MQSGIKGKRYKSSTTKKMSLTGTTKNEEQADVLIGEPPVVRRSKVITKLENEIKFVSPNRGSIPSSLDTAGLRESLTDA